MRRKIKQTIFLSLVSLVAVATPVLGAGSLNIQIEPTALCANNIFGVKAGWRIDNETDWRDCSTLASGLTEGEHTVYFKQLEGWIHPEDLVVTIINNQVSAPAAVYENTTLSISASGQIAAGNYFASSGGDVDGDGVIDLHDTTLLQTRALEVTPGQLYLFSQLGGSAATTAYFAPTTSPSAAGDLTLQANDILYGTGTFSKPQDGSALSYRNVLFATQGAEALKAFYANAIAAFTPRLSDLTDAEELYRIALRVNPYHEAALDGLLEVYYARAEGFMLIGNDFMAKAYRNKYERQPTETKSINELELGGITNGLVAYETGFREFMKLFNPGFVDSSQRSQPHLNLDAEWLLFEKRFDSPGGKISFEAKRGQSNVIGLTTQAWNNIGEQISTIQGSPSLSFSDNQSGQIAAVDTQIKFLTPIVDGSASFAPGSTFKLRFEMDIEPGQDVKELELLVGFNFDVVDVSTDINDYNFSTSDLGIDLAGNPNQVEIVGPGQFHPDSGVEVAQDQLLLIIHGGVAAAGNRQEVVSMPFTIKNTPDTQAEYSATGSVDVSAYVNGSGGLMLSGFKDVGILYRLAAAHAYATSEKVRRLYSMADDTTKTECLDLIQEEIDRIGSWFEHIQSLLAKSATQDQLASIDRLQAAINQVSSEINGLLAFRDFINSGSNVFGFPEEYVPFYNTGANKSFDAIRTLVTGSATPGSFNPQTASGFFGYARGTETVAKNIYSKLQDTRDRIRNEVFTIYT